MDFEEAVVEKKTEVHVFDLTTAFHPIAVACEILLTEDVEDNRWCIPLPFTHALTLQPPLTHSLSPH